MLDGNHTVSVLRITGSRVKVNISDVSIMNGFSDTSFGGGGLDVNAPSALVILDHVSVCNNSGGAQGGGASVRGGAALVSLFSLWANNTAGAVGGALVASASEVALQNSVFVGNTALRAAVYTNNTDLQVHFCLFANNSGGAITVGPQLNDQASSITFTHFLGNRGMNGSAIDAFGVHHRRLRLTLSHDAFEDNNAIGFGGALASSGGVSTVSTGCSYLNNRDSCNLVRPYSSGKGATVYLNADPDLGCTDVFTAVAQAWPLCAQWLVPVGLVRRSTANATCLPLPSSPLGPFCCEHSLVPLFCAAVPKASSESDTCD